MYLAIFGENEFRCKTNHYRFVVNRRVVVYTYIRKNACSAFKRLIGEQRSVGGLVNRLRRFGSRFDPDDLSHIKYCKVYPDEYDFGKADHLVFVCRDPFERVVSLYLNKFVESKGAEDIRRSFERICGKSADQATFEDFLVYLSGEFSSLDPHCYPQKSHLLSAAYTDPIDIKNLYRDIRKIIGEKLADRFFLHPVNAVGKGGSKLSECLVTYPARELEAMWRRGVSFHKGNFSTDEACDFIRYRYQADYEMLDNIKRQSRPLARG